jgi:hypothetical protein
VPNPDFCPVCGSEVPPEAPCCPECGADDQTGWSETATAQRLGLPDDEFDHDEFVREEFGQPNRVKPKGVSWLWWVVAIALVLLFLSFLLKVLPVLSIFPTLPP